MNLITNNYLHNLQAIYCDIGERGIRVDFNRIQQAKKEVLSLINTQLAIASSQWNCKVFIGKDSVSKDEKDCVNLNSTQGERALLNKLKNLGYNVPKIQKKNDEGEYESAYSTGELALQKMLSENKFNIAGGDPAIRAVLKIRELGKIMSQYLNARFLPRLPATKEEETLYYFISSYNVAGTVTLRRSSRKHTFGFGGNAQNFPKHSDTAKIFRECLVPGIGNIFLMVDQIQAEDWPVSALAGNLHALEELRTGVDRHSKLATSIFGKFIAAKGSPQWDDKTMDTERYLGKKVRHASNYDMQAPRMSEALAQEGFSMPASLCADMLQKAYLADPSVRDVFHKYIQEQLSQTRMLKCPLGNERMFIGARPNANNNTVFKEAYAFIPQSTVGCNTGLAVYELETLYPKEERKIIQEGHDSIVQDIRREPEEIWKYLQRTVKAFDRNIRFHNGIEINIPIEAELGISMGTSVEFRDLSLEGVKAALKKLEEKLEEEEEKRREKATLAA